MSSKSKALLIGINYIGTDSQLNGCINDVKNMREFLLSKGYAANDIKVITEETSVKPTRINIINALLELILSGAPKLFFHYSGHGSYTVDSSKDESDKRDECLVPLDYVKEGMITDDQISGLCSFLKPTSTMIAVLDCCHSGTGFDLCYTLTPIQKFVQKSGAREKDLHYVMRAADRYADTPGQVIMLSGCLDPQTSADAFINKTYQGALTCTLLSLVKNGKKTWGELMVALRENLKKDGYDQIPNLTSGQPLDIDSPSYF